MQKHRFDRDAFSDDKSLASAAFRAGILPESVGWLKAASDPFHDNELIAYRAPSASRARTLLWDKRVSMTISRPSSVPSTENWDCHIAHMPAYVAGAGSIVNANLVTDPYNSNAGRINVSSDTGWDQGSPVILICSVPAGEDSFQFSNLDTQWNYLGVYELCQLGVRARVIGGAYEVHNTTAEISQQGTVVDYRVENNPEPMSLVWSTNQIADVQGDPVLLLSSQPITTLVTKGPPRTAAQATQANGVTRKAKEGSLVPFVFDNVDLELRPGCIGPVVHTYEPVNGLAPCLASWGNAQMALAPAVTEMTTYRESPFSQCGSYFTGLSPDTTLTITLRLMFELAPGPADPLMAMATMSPEYDPVAINALTAAQSHLAAGYPVSHNASGDFRRTMYRLLHKALPVMKTVFGALSGAGGIVGAIGQAGSAGVTIEEEVERYAKKNKESKRQRKLRELAGSSRPKPNKPSAAMLQGVRLRNARQRG